VTSAEAIAASVTGWLALTAIAGYAIDALGFGIQPWAALALALGFTGAAAALRPRPLDPSIGDVIAWSGIVIFLIAMLDRKSVV